MYPKSSLLKAPAAKSFPIFRISIPSFRQEFLIKIVRKKSIASGTDAIEFDMFPLKKPRNPSLAQIDVKPEPKFEMLCSALSLDLAAAGCGTWRPSGSIRAAIVASDVAAMRIAMTFSGELTVLETIPEIPPAIK